MRLLLTITLLFAPFVLVGCQTSQVTTSSFAGFEANKAPVATAVALEENLVPSKAFPKFRTALAKARDANSAKLKRTTQAKGSEETSASKKILSKKTAAASGKKKSKRTNTVKFGRQHYGSMIARHARAHGVPVKLAMAVVEVESSYRPMARGSAGEIGLMQLLPSTARYIGYKGPMKKLYHPDTNIAYGMKYLGKAHRLGGGSLCGTILKYNAGHGAKKMNKISRTYCQRIKRIMARSTAI